LINLHFCVSLLRRRSTTVSLEANAIIHLELMALSQRHIYYFVAGTRRFNSANDATIKIGVIWSPQPHAQIEAGLNSFVRSRRQNLVAATAFSYKTCHCVMSLQSVAYGILTSRNIQCVSFKLCLIAPATCKKYSGYSPSPSPPPEQKPPYYPTFSSEGTTGI